MRRNRYYIHSLTDRGTELTTKHYPLAQLSAMKSFNVFKEKYKLDGKTKITKQGDHMKCPLSLSKAP